MLTNAAVKAARPMARAYKIFDERGLHLFVSPAGLRAWRLKYRFAGREKLLSIGRYPDLALVEARERADDARELLARGIDPSGGQLAGARKSFEEIARAWFSDRNDRWSEAHAHDVIASLENDVFPRIGKNPVDAIEAIAVLDIVRAIEARGAHETARRVRQRIDAVFSYALVRKLCTANPAALIAAELAPAPIGRQHHPAFLEIELARELLEASELVDAAPIVKKASRFLALTAVRMATLRAATWAEIEGLDRAQPLWRIPAEHMKLTKARKADPVNAHVIPLSPPAVRILQQLRENGCHTRSPLIFPISQGAIGALYDRAGSAGRHVPHGWRASFSTILNEHCPGDKALIDQALAHVPTNKVEAAYNRAEHLARRRDLFRRWAELLMG
ncbi:MAG: integrase [Sphingobium sp. 66-54]|nr:MAG: integrase [Sphingobium sp. 66-54]